MTHKPEPPFKPEPIEPPGIESEMCVKPQYKAKKYKVADKLTNKVALITGGDSGIGRAVALLFAREGADIALTYLPEEEKDANVIASEIKALGREVLLLAGNVADYSFCEAVAKRVIEKFNKINIVVNNAAFQNHVKKIEMLDLDQWHKTFKVNIDGYFYIVKALIPHLKEEDCIINTGSITGLEGSPGLLDYSATKGAIHAFTKSLAQQLMERKIRVNCVAPGPVWTPLNPAERGDAIKHFGESTLIGRPAQPEEIAPAYVFLASNADSGYISGHVLPILGGNTIAG